MSQSTQPPRSYSFVSTSLLVVSIVFPILATGAVALRFWARSMKSQGLRADDWTVVMSLIMSWAISINTIVVGGIAGVEFIKINSLVAARVFLKCIWIEVILWAIGLASIKISILLFYRRIFVTVKFKWSVFSMIAVVVGWALSTVLVQIFIGDPISSVWDPLAPKLRINNTRFSIAVASTNILFDVIVLCFPLPMIRRLQMPMRRKIIIAGIFWLGAFCCVASAIRLSIISANVASKASEVNQYNASTKGSTWTHIEPNCSIIAACLPTYGNLFTEKLTIFSSLRNFFSLGSRFRSSNKKISGEDNGSQNSILGNSNRNNKSRHNWQVLDKDVDINNVELTAQRGREFGAAEDDTEAGIELMTPMRLDVRRDLGSEIGIV